jgi:hypothetical protein
VNERMCERKLEMMSERVSECELEMMRFRIQCYIMQTCLGRVLMKVSLNHNQSVNFNSRIMGVNE